MEGGCDTRYKGLALWRRGKTSTHPPPGNSLVRGMTWQNRGAAHSTHVKNSSAGADDKKNNYRRERIIEGKYRGAREVFSLAGRALVSMPLRLMEPAMWETRSWCC
jgi:hypothetical protein